MTAKRLLRQIGLKLIAQSETDEVDWDQIKCAGLDLQLMAFDEQEGRIKEGFQLCK